MGWHYYGYGPMMGYDGGGFLALALGIVWFVVLIAIAAALLRTILGRGRHKGQHFRFGSDPALDLLRERYAKGEIDRAEFEEKKKDLSA